MDKKQTELVENLKAAGCSEETILQYMEGDEAAKERLLKRHRRDLLEDMHRCQRKIDCLDYLRYQKQKEGE